MPRDLVERSFPGDFNIPSPDTTAQDRLLSIETRTLLDVGFVQSPFHELDNDQ